MKRKIIFTSFFIFMLYFCSVWAQSKQTVNGYILDANGLPLKDILVHIVENNNKTYTDQQGRFAFFIEEGNYTMNLLYEKEKISRQKVYLTAANPIKIKLPVDLKVITLKTISINAPSKRPYKKDKISDGLRLNMPILETPQNIQVISKEVLNDQNITDTHDGFERNVSGVYRVSHHNATTIMNIRGLYVDFERFRNGIRFLGLHSPMPEDMSFMEDIEFIKGPASFMISNGPPSGLYNFVLKKPTGKNKNSVTLRSGSFNNYRAELDLDGNFSKSGIFQYRISAMGQKKGLYTENYYKDGFALAPSLKYKSKYLSITGLYLYHFNQIPSYTNYMASDIGFKALPQKTGYAGKNKDPINIDEHNVFLDINYKINDRWKLTNKWSYLRYRSHGADVGPLFQWKQSPIDFKTGDATLNFDLVDNLSTNHVGQLLVSGEFKTNDIKHNLLAGVDAGIFKSYRDVSDLKFLKGYNIYTRPNFDKALQPNLSGYEKGTLKDRVLQGRFNPNNELGQALRHQENKHYSVYIQNNISFFDDKLRLDLAGRYTHTKRLSTNTSGKVSGQKRNSKDKSEDKVFTPRVGLSLSYIPNATVYTLYDNSFQENFGFIKDKGAAKPSVGRNLEIGFKNQWFNGLLNTTLSLYRIDKNNITSKNEEDKKYVVQNAKARSQGVEFDLQGSFNKNLSAVFNYAYNDAKSINKTTNKKTPLGGTVKHMTNAWATYNFDSKALSGLGISLGYRWAAHRFSFRTDGAKVLPNDLFTLDAAVSYKKPKYSISLALNNVTNRYNYEGWIRNPDSDPIYVWNASPPRNFLLNVSYHF